MEQLTNLPGYNANEKCWIHTSPFVRLGWEPELVIADNVGISVRAPMPNLKTSWRCQVPGADRLVEVTHQASWMSEDHICWHAVNISTKGINIRSTNQLTWELKLFKATTMPKNKGEDERKGVGIGIERLIRGTKQKQFGNQFRTGQVKLVKLGLVPTRKQS